MDSRALIFLAAGCVALSAAAAAQSLPTDNDQWQTRCAGLVQSGGLPNPDPSGIAAARFEQLARERSSSGQHFVACTLFFAAAAGQSAARNDQQTRNDASLAKIEQKMGAGQKLSFLDKLMRSSDIIAHASDQSLPANQNEMAVLAMMSQPPTAMGTPPSFASAAPPYASQPQYPAPPPYANAYGGPPQSAGGASSYSPPQAYPGAQPPSPADTAQGFTLPTQQANPQAYGAQNNSLPGSAPYAQPSVAGAGAAQPQYGTTYPSPPAAYPPSSYPGSSSAMNPSTPPQYSGSTVPGSPAAAPPLPPAGSATYAPLPNGQVADTGAGRMQWVLQHPSAYGTPPACEVDWTGSGPLSQKCADSLYAQAEAARQSGNCIAALTDYDNAKQAAQNSGQIIFMNMQETGGRSACMNKLYPPKSDPAAHYGQPGAMPVGRYTCYTAAAMIANGGAYGTTAVTLGQFGGYMWVFDAHRYAGADIKNAGTYMMRGNTIAIQSGPYAGKGSKLTWAAHGAYGRPTIYLAYLDDQGNPMGGLGCTYDGPPAQ